MFAINTSPHGANPPSDPISEEVGLELKIKGIFTAAQIRSETPRQYVLEKVMHIEPSEFNEAIAIANRLMQEKLAGADPLDRMELLCQRASQGLAITEILRRELSAQGYQPLPLDQMTDVEIAAVLGHKELVDILLSRDDAISVSRVLSFAFCGKQHALVAHLLERKDLALFDPSGTHMLPIQTAISNGMETFLEQLIEKGCDVNACDSSGAYPLTVAANQGKISVMDFLYIYGAKDVINEGEQTILIADTITADASDEAVTKLLQRTDTKKLFESGAFHIRFLMYSPRLFNLCVQLLPNSSEITYENGKNLWTEAVETFRLNDEQMQALSTVLDINSEDARGLTVLDLAVRGKAQNSMQTLVDKGAYCLSTVPEQFEASLEAAFQSDKTGTIACLFSRCSATLQVADPAALVSFIDQQHKYEDVLPVISFVISKGVNLKSIWDRITSKVLYWTVFNAMREEKHQEHYLEQDFSTLFVIASNLYDFPFLEKLIDENKVQIALEGEDIRLSCGSLLKSDYGQPSYAIVHRKELSEKFGSLGHLSFLLKQFPYFMGEITQNPYLAEMIEDERSHLTFLMGVYGYTTLGQLFTGERPTLYALHDAGLYLGKISREDMWPPFKQEQRKAPLPFETFFEWLQNPRFENELKVAQDLFSILRDPSKFIMGMPQPWSNWKENFESAFGEILAVLQEPHHEETRQTFIADFYECKGLCVTAWDNLISRWQDTLFSVESKDGNGKSAFYAELRKMADKGVDKAVQALKPHYQDELEGSHVHFPDAIGRYFEEISLPVKRTFAPVDNLYSIPEDLEDVVYEAFTSEFHAKLVFEKAVEVDNSEDAFSISDWALSKAPELFVTPELLRKQNKFYRYTRERNLIDALAARKVVVMRNETPERAFQRVMLTQLMLENADSSKWSIINQMSANDRLPKVVSQDLKRKFKAIGISVRNQESGEDAVQRVAGAKYALGMIDTNPREALLQYGHLISPIERSPKKMRSETDERLGELKGFLNEVLSGDLKQRVFAPEECINALREEALKQYIQSLNENGSPIHQELNALFEKGQLYPEIPKHFRWSLFALPNIEEMLEKEGLQRKNNKESLEALLKREKLETYQELYRGKTENIKAAILNVLIEEGIIAAPKIDRVCPLDEDLIQLIEEHLKDPKKMSVAELRRAITSLD